MKIRKNKVLLLLLTLVLLFPINVKAIQSTLWTNGRIGYTDRPGYGTKIFHVTTTGTDYENRSKYDGSNTENAACIEPAKLAPGVYTNYTPRELTDSDYLNSISDNCTAAPLKWFMFFSYGAPGDEWMKNENNWNVWDYFEVPSEKRYLVSHLMLTYAAGGNPYAVSGSKTDADKAVSIYQFLSGTGNQAGPSSYQKYRYWGSDNKWHFKYGDDESQYYNYNNFHAYIINENASTQTIVYWEYINDEVVQNKYGHIVVPKQDKHGNPVPGVMFVLCNDYNTCKNIDPSDFDLDQCKSLTTQDGGPCLQVSTTGEDYSHPGEAYFGKEMDNGHDAFPVERVSDTSTHHYLYIRELVDTNNTYKTTWDSGQPKIYKISITSEGENKITDEWALQETQDAWMYPNGFVNGQDGKSDEAVTNGTEEGGAIKITKLLKNANGDSYTPTAEELEGWEFRVWENGVETGTIVTDSTGSFTYGDDNGRFILTPGVTYKFKELTDSINGKRYAHNASHPNLNGKFIPELIDENLSSPEKWADSNVKAIEMTIVDADMGSCVFRFYENKREGGAIQIRKEFKNQDDSSYTPTTEEKEGWAFKVYEFDNSLSGQGEWDCQTNPGRYIGEIVTDANGQFTYGDDNGTYILKPNIKYTFIEVTDANGYAVNRVHSNLNGIWKPGLTCAHGDVTNETMQQLQAAGYPNKKENKKYCLKIQKTDAEDSNNKLSNAIFSLNGTNQTCTTSDNNKVCTFKNLDKQSYTVTETAAPDGYCLDDTSGNSKTISYSDSELTEMVNGECPESAPVKTKSDHKKYYCAKVKKIDSRTKELIKGASYKIEGTSTEHTDDWDGHNDGYTTFFTETSNSSITVRETVAPEGYELYNGTLNATPVQLPCGKTKAQAEAECKAITCEYNSQTNKDTCKYSDGTVITGYNTDTLPTYPEKKYYINWYKVTENGSTKANGAKFKVKKQNANDGNVYIKVKSDLVQEADAGSGNGTSKKCYVFDSFVSEANASQLESMNTNTNGSTSNGEVCIQKIPKGTYTVIETKPAKYHTFGNETRKDITTSTTFQAMSDDRKFKNLTTRFEFTKTVSSGDEGDWAAITTAQLKKIPFNVYDPSGNLLSFVLVDGVYKYASNDIDGPSGTPVTDLYLNDSRKIIIEHLPVADGYSIKEKGSNANSNSCTCPGDDGACVGFYYPKYENDSDHKFNITECSNPSADSTVCSSSNKAATQGLNNTPTSIEFTKDDLYQYADASSVVKFEDEQEIDQFDKITFKLKEKNSNTYMKLVYVGKSGTCLTEDSYAIYRYVPAEFASGLQLTEDLHTCGGHIKITNLCRNKEYTIVETAVPEDTVFTLPDGGISVNYKIPCCEPTTKTSDEKQTISDTPTRIEINKKNNSPNQNIHEANQADRIETATFEVYKCAKTVSKCTLSNKIGDKLKFHKPMVKQGETIYPFQFNQKTTDSNTVTTLTLTTEGEKGKLVLTHLPANYKYVVVETNGPDGYYNLNGTALAELEIPKVPTNTTRAAANTFDKSNYPTQIRFTKDDIYKYYNSGDLAKLQSSDKIFDTMTFKLHDENGNIVKLYKISDGVYRFINEKGEHNGTVEELHPSNGEILITHLYRGYKENNQTKYRMYYIEETKADTMGNFVLPNNIQNTKAKLGLSDSKYSNITLPSAISNNHHPIVAYPIGIIIPDANNPTSVPESLTELIDNIPTRVVFAKRDKRTNELIKDEEDNSNNGIRTTFEVYACEKSVSSCTVDNGQKIYFNQRTYIPNLTSDLESSYGITNPIYVYEYNKLNANTGVSELITDRGLLVLGYLPSTYKYVLYEKVAPNGYYQPRKLEAQTEFTVQDTTIDVVHDYEDLTERVVNTPTEIMFKKSDVYDYYKPEDQASIDKVEKLFDTAKFVLRDSHGNILNVRETETNEEEGHVYRYLFVNEDNNITYLNTYKGKMKITNLYRDSVYYIEEVATTDPANFILPDYLEFEGLPFDNKGHPVVKYVIPENEPADKTTLTMEIENIPTRVRFEKRDSKYNYLIPDETATFQVYQCKKGTKCHPSEGITSDMTLINFAPRSTITGDLEDSGVEVYKYNKLNQPGETNLHPDKGVLVLRYLPAGYNYVLLETVAPVNYNLPIGRNAETEFEVLDNTVYIDSVDMPNVPTSILIKKYSSDGKLLKGAQFRIYEATTEGENGPTCDANLDAMNQPKTEVQLKTIRDGVYEARPVTDTNIIQTCDNANGTCSDIPINEVTKLTYTDYLGSWADFSNVLTDKKENIQLAEGEALIQYLRYNRCYIIEEVKAPDGYSLPENPKDRFTMVTIEENEQYAKDTDKTFINMPTPFTFYKFDEYNNLIDGAEFKLQKLDDNKKYNDLTVTKEEINGEVFYKVDPNSENKTITTKDGKATVYYLEEGQYRILETKAAPGKELGKNPNVATFFVDDSGNVYGNAIISNKSKTEKLEITSSSSAEFIISPRTGMVVIKYGLIIAVLVAGITGLMIFQRKKK